MFLLVLRLLAVYFGTVAASLRLAHRFVSGIRPRSAVLLALGPFLFVGKALLTAGVHAPIDIPYECKPPHGGPALLARQFRQRPGVERRHARALPPAVLLRLATATAQRRSGSARKIRQEILS